MSYESPLANYLLALKYGGDRSIGRSLGRLLAEAVGDRRGSVDALVSVPLHAQRLAERGYNQALEIACGLSGETRLPILCAGIERNKATLPQARLSCAARHANLTGAFTITRALGGKRIAIIDDVITTGATVNALAAALLLAGACHVEAWVVARTQPATGDVS